MRLLAVTLLALAPSIASAQTLIDSAAADRIIARLQRLGGAAPPLPCEIRALKPALNFGLRLQSGYVYRVPMSEFSGPAPRLTVLLRIAPPAGQPVYLTDRFDLPATSSRSPVAEATGIFFLGEGHYRMSWLLADETGRVCRKNWELDAVAAPNTKVAMAPGMVSGVALPGGPARLQRLTVLVDAAPILPASGSALQEPAAPGDLTHLNPNARAPLASDPPPLILRPGDQTLLIGGLSALLERLPSAAVRLVVFNLEAQKELFRSDAFSPGSLNDVALALNQAQFGTVDYRVLMNHTGQNELLARLLNEELRAETHSDAVIILGARERFPDAFPARLLDANPRALPFFLLALETAPARAPAAATPFAGIDADPSDAEGRAMRRSAAVVVTSRPDGLADIVSAAVRKLNGKMFAVQSPARFTKAVDEIERRLKPRR
jgi:hypothetical protein